jgi:four helix bundle protein
MAKIERFEEIEAWRQARVLAAAVNEAATTGVFARDYGLRDQIQRATVSVMSNIAEGFGSGSNASFAQFLRYAYRSAIEVQSQLYIALDRGYIAQERFTELYDHAEQTISLIAGFLRYLKQAGQTR